MFIDMLFCRGVCFDYVPGFYFEFVFYAFFCVV